MWVEAEPRTATGVAETLRYVCPLWRGYIQHQFPINVWGLDVNTLANQTTVQDADLMLLP